MRSTFKILFYLNTSKKKQSGLCPVLGRITVDGGIAQFSIKEYAHPDSWDVKKGRLKGNSRENSELNRKLDQTEQDIRNIYQQTVDTNGFVTAEQIKNEITGVTAKSKNLLELFREHNLEYEKRVDVDRRKGSYAAYKYAYQHLSGYILSKYGQEDYALKQLNLSFINDYTYYLRVDAELKTNTAIPQVFILRKIIKRAMNQGIINRDPFDEYVPGKWEMKYFHISCDELEKIMTVQISSKAVCFVRDMFVFSCFTELAYSDMCQLSVKHLRSSPDGSTWIDIHRQKTGVECNIRLVDIPVIIIEKYRHERKSDCLFNMIGKSGICQNLRKIEKMCGISHLHFHMARHTFATLICLMNGVSIEVISKAMGHSSLRTTQIYAEITSQKVREDMMKLANRTKGKFKMNCN